MQKGFLLISILVAAGIVILIIGSNYYLKNIETLNHLKKQQKNINNEPTSSPSAQCGDGVCQEVVCLAIGCPQPETPQNCPQDCK